MNEPDELPPLAHCSTPDTSSCSIISIIPTLGMSSCRGRAEAFARSLSSKLRTLGSQSDDDCAAKEEDEPIINGKSEAANTATVSEKQTNSWLQREVAEDGAAQAVTNMQPLRQDTDSFFDFDCELESPGSPVDECEYLRLIETASNTPQNSGGESGYVCASTPSSTCSNDDTLFDVNDISIKETQLKNESYQLNGTLTNEATEPLDDTLENTTEIQQILVTELDTIPSSVTDAAIVTETVENITNGHDICLKKEEDLENQIETTVKNEDEKLRNNSTLSGLDTTDDEDECRPQRVRRCSSLKTGKTPPGTPGRKKIVRFADKLGLDLADIKTFLDEIPNIPKSAYEDLEIIDTETPILLGPKSDKILVPLFQQPGGLPTFLDLVRERQVSLENAAVTDHINQTITGSVRVRNLDFHKSVHIRYTLDHWRSFADLQANYVENSCDGFSDKFSFILFGNSMQVGQRLEFAVRFQCKGQQFWDNNYGINYCFQCLPATNSTTATLTVTTTATTTTTIQHNHLNSNNYLLNNNKFAHIGGNTFSATHKSEQHQTNALKLFSPTVGETWCSSFY